MTDRRGPLLAPLLLAVALVLFAACSSGGDNTDDAGADSTTTSEPDDSTGGADDDLAAGSNGDDLFSSSCQDAISEFLRVQTSFGTAAASVMQGVDAGAETAADMLDALAEAAPSEIAADFQVYAEQLGQYFEAIAALDIQPGAPPDQATMEQLAALTDALDTDALEAASEHIDAWFEANCG